VSERRTESLLRELVDGLEPVRPVPTVRGLVLAVVGAFAVAAALNGIWPGLTFAPPPAWRSLPFLALLAGLATAAAGSLRAVATGAIPGREAAARSGRRVAVAGALLATAGGVAGVAAADDVMAHFPLGVTVACACRASLLAVLPAAVLCVYLTRAFERRPRVGAAFACLGAAALGAAWVHATCPLLEPLHGLLGHWVGPAGVGLLLALPVSLWLGQRGGAPPPTSPGGASPAP
jgi:hypothetical protein